MQTIKFRYRIRTDGQVITSIVTLESLEQGLKIDGEILSRDLWTGLLDKAGVEVYAGDIVAQEDPSYLKKDGTPRKRVKSRWWDKQVVEFGEFEGNYGGFDCDGEPYLGWNVLPGEMPTLQVIGSVHTNPELMEGK